MVAERSARMAIAGPVFSSGPGFQLTSGMIGSSARLTASSAMCRPAAVRGLSERVAQSAYA
jgi:hypothetical protein